MFESLSLQAQLNFWHLLEWKKKPSTESFPSLREYLCHKEYLDRSHIVQTAKMLFFYIFYTGRVKEQTTFFYSLQSVLVVEQELVRAWSVNLPWSASKYYLVSHSIFLFCFVQQVAQWHLQLEKNVCRKPGPFYSNLIQFTKPSGLEYGNSGKLTYEPGQAQMRFQAVANSKFKAGVFRQLWEEVERKKWLHLYGLKPSKMVQLYINYDNLCCSSFCQTAWQLNSPATDSGVLVALLLTFKTEGAFNPGSVFVLDCSCQ